jgi:dTDP-glucose 4,6-dehydratase
MSKTWLITGGAGFIGSNFVHHLHARHPDDRMLVLDLLTYAGNTDNLPAEFQSSVGGPLQFHYGDIRNASLVDSLVGQVDTVVHFAAETHVTRSIYDNYHFFETDVLGTQVLVNSVLRHADRVERFIHISTSEVYGTALTDLMDEQHPLMPTSPYASAKTGADRLVYSYWATYKLPVVIVRPFNNYGPRQHLEKAVARFITSCLLGEPLRVHGDGSARRDWTFVEDTCEAIDRIANAPLASVAGEVFNIGQGHSLSIAEIASAIARKMGTPDSSITYVGDRPGQVFRHTCDARKAERLCGWRPRTSLDQGLDRTIAWYGANRPAWQKQLWMREIPIVTAAGKRELH